VVPGEGAALQIWILGSSGGESAEVAGANGLRFAANYHVSPATVLEAVDGYRAAFQPSAELDRPASACRQTSSWPAPRPRPANWPPATACGCAATITHDHAGRVRSYQLLADEWARR
jgi:hypothetical protein